MFDIGWSEMAVIALLTLIVIGPRELPRVLRTVGQWVRKAQSLASSSAGSTTLRAKPTWRTPRS